MWAATSSGEYKLSVRPFFVRGFHGDVEFSLLRKPAKEDWYPAVFPEACFLRGPPVEPWPDFKVSAAASTEPSEANKASKRRSVSSQGCKDASKASLTSVESSSVGGGHAEELCSWGRFRT